MSDLNDGAGESKPWPHWPQGKHWTPRGERQHPAIHEDTCTVALKCPCGDPLWVELDVVAYIPNGWTPGKPRTITDGFQNWDKVRGAVVCGRCHPTKGEER